MHPAAMDQLRENSMETAIYARGLSKRFVLHNQGGIEIPVFDKLDFSICFGEGVALHGPSGSGKSTLLRSLYANYKPDAGSIWIRHAAGFVDLTRASAQTVLEIRKQTLGYVSQFLRVIPRIPTLTLVAEPLVRNGCPGDEARERAADLLDRLQIPTQLFELSPLTFSGGEQQRVNIARGFILGSPILLLDEPTASLDPVNARTVIDLIREAISKGTAVVGIYHDQEVRRELAGKTFDMPGAKESAWTRNGS